jgi:hypothetical protein
MYALGEFVDGPHKFVIHIDKPTQIPRGFHYSLINAWCVNCELAMLPGKSLDSIVLLKCIHFRCLNIKSWFSGWYTIGLDYGSFPFDSRSIALVVVVFTLLYQYKPNRNNCLDDRRF